MSLRDAQLCRAEDAAAAAAMLVADTMAWLAAQDREPLHLAVSGGSLGEVVLPQLIAAGSEAGFDWRRVHFWFADERFLPADDAERNALLLRAALSSLPDFPLAQVHEVAAAGGPQSVSAAARAYSDAISRTVPTEAGAPCFDVVLLGMGPDGHTASLFPGKPEVQVQDAIALAVHDSPKPPAERVTLSLPVLNAARLVAVYATGSSKREALADALGSDQLGLPISQLVAREQLRLYADAAALGDIELL